MKKLNERLSELIGRSAHSFGGEELPNAVRKELYRFRKLHSNTMRKAEVVVVPRLTYRECLKKKLDMERVIMMFNDDLGILWNSNVLIDFRPPVEIKGLGHIEGVHMIGEGIEEHREFFTSPYFSGGTNSYLLHPEASGSFGGLYVSVIIGREDRRDMLALYLIDGLWKVDVDLCPILVGYENYAAATELARKISEGKASSGQIMEREAPVEDGLRNVVALALYGYFVEKQCKMVLPRTGQIGVREFIFCATCGVPLPLSYEKVEMCPFRNHALVVDRRKLIVTFVD